MAEYPNIIAPPQIYPANGQIGAVGGGVMRPGAIDQGQFQQMLQAQYQAQTQEQAQTQGKAATEPHGMTLSDYRKLAGSRVASAAMVQHPNAALPASDAPLKAPLAKAPTASAGDGIPTLSLEQFAALTGISVPESPSPPVEAPPAGIQKIFGQGVLGQGVPGQRVPGQIVHLETSPIETADATPFDPAATEAEPETPVDMADGVPVTPPENEPAAAQQPANPRVVLFDTMPDREEQRQVAAQGKTWRLKETPGAQELFLGPDGKFGWDDFVDIINPLQHIPVVAQIYRAVTGDQAYGLSAFLGALPFGPLSVAGAVVDTVVRAQTGRDAGTDMAASILGIDNRTPEEADLHLVDGTGQMAAVSADTAGPSDAQSTAIQVATTGTEAGSAWTRESADLSRG